MARLAAACGRLGLGGITGASGLGTLSLGGLIDLAFQAAPARRRLAAFHHLSLVGGPVRASHLDTLSLGGWVVNLAIQAAVSLRLAGFYGFGLVGGPVASNLDALTFGGLVDLAVGAAPAFRLAVAIPILLVVRREVAALIRAFRGVTEACCLAGFQAVGTVAGAFEKNWFVVSSGC